MKNGEDFRQAMGQADDGFIRVIHQALRDLQVMRKPRRARPRRSRPSGLPRDSRPTAPLSRDA